MPKHSVLLALSTATLTLAGCLADMPADELDATSEAATSGEDSSGEAPEPDPEPATPTTGEDEPVDPGLAELSSCEPGEVEACAYGGPPKTEAVGTCAAAVRVCGADGEWGACAGEVLPRTEDCRNQTDDDCDGRVACDGKIEWLRGLGEAPDGTPGAAGVYGVTVDDAGHGWVTGWYQQSLKLGEQVRDVGGDLGMFVVEYDGQSLPRYNFGDEQEGAFGRGLMLANDGTRHVAVGAECERQLAVHESSPTYTTADDTMSTVVAMLETDGEYAWSRAFQPSAFGRVSLGALAFAPTGDLWVGGSANGANVVTNEGPLLLENHGGHDAILVKLAPTGQIAYAGSFGDSGEQRILDIAVDAAGDVWLAGSFTGAMQFDGGLLYAGVNESFHRDMFVVKLDAAGKFQWGRVFGDGEDQSFSQISIDDAGDAWVFGEYEGEVEYLGDTTLSGAGLVVAKFAADSKVLWARAWDCDGHCDVAQTAVDGAGQAVVGVMVYPGATTTINEQPFVNTGDEELGVIVKLDRAGLTVWAAEPFPGWVNLDVGPRGEVFVAGQYHDKVSFADGAFHLDAGIEDRDIYVAHLRP